MLAIFNFNFFMKVIEREEKRWKASIMQNSHVPNNFYLTSSYFRFPAQSGKNWYSPGPWADLDKVFSCGVFMSLWVLMLVSAFFWQNLINIKHQHNELSINTSRGTKLNYMLLCNWFSYSKQWGAGELKIVTKVTLSRCTGCPRKNALLCSEAYNSSSEAIIEKSRGIFQILRLSAFIWAQVVQDYVKASMRKFFWDTLYLILSLGWLSWVSLLYVPHELFDIIHLFAQ